MTAIEIQDLVISELMRESPQYFSSILKSKNIFDRKQSSVYDTLIRSLMAFRLIEKHEGGKFDYSMNMSYKMTGYGINTINKFGSFSKFYENENKILDTEELKILNPAKYQADYLSMTDRDIVIKTIGYLQTFDDYRSITPFWKEELGLTEGRQAQIRNLLLKGELINFHQNDHSTFILTARGRLAKPSNFDQDGLYKENTNKNLREKYPTLSFVVLGVFAYIAGIFSPVFTDMAKSKFLKETSELKIDTVILTDTVIAEKIDTVYIVGKKPKKKSN
jgi:hypothetical protein